MQPDEYLPSQNPYSAPPAVDTPPPGALPAPYLEPRPRRAVVLPLVLFVATCISTYLVKGPEYAVAVMLILTAHELGHFFQTLKYGVEASFPLFIPMPISPLGTMGAVIAMAPGEGDRKSLFDIAVSGPIAGLIPSLICCEWGLQLSEMVDFRGVPLGPQTQFYGEPLLFQGLIYLQFGARPEGFDVNLHPIAFAGWVGLLITALNLFPIGQLDGGHTLYSLLGPPARKIAVLVWGGCFIAVVLTQNWGWLLMLGLLWMMGPEHPPTADDSVPLGTGRKILGWALLAFLPFGFTPTPFIMPQFQQEGPPPLSAADHNLTHHGADTGETQQAGDEQNLQSLQGHEQPPSKMPAKGDGFPCPTDDRPGGHWLSSASPAVAN